MRFAFFFILCFSIIQSAVAQPPCSTITNMSPQTAIAVCGTTTFTQGSVATCTGTDVSGTGACGGSNSSDNAFWYKFHCYQSGTLGFLITPQNLSDDYDWELFNVTGVANLNQLYTDERLMVSLNLCGSPNGITGCAPTGVDSINCGGFTNLINRLATIYAGNDYLLMVNRYSNSPFGYTLKFAGGTAVITDPALPEVNSVSTDGCHRSMLKVQFSKDIACTSVSPDGSEFSITPAGAVITGISAACATTSSTITELTIQLQSPLPGGNYNLVVNPGADANTFSDVCGNDMVTGFSIPFTITETAPPVIQSFGYDECHYRDRLIVNFDKPVDCASLTATGSEFRFSPPGPVITGISNNCGSGSYTSSVTLFLQNQVPTSIFNVVILNGTDGNTLSDTCASFMPQGSNRSFTATLPPRPFFDSVQVDDCDPTFVRAFFNHPILCSSILANGLQFVATGPSPVAILSATGDVNCGAVGYTHSILFQFAAPISTAGNYTLAARNLGSSSVLDTCTMPQKLFDNIVFYTPGKIAPAFNSQLKWGCIQDTIVLSHPGGNGINSWIWKFSDGSTASGQQVSATFPVTTPTVTVKLVVSNGSCSDSTSQVLTLDNYFKAGFSISPVDSFCVNTPVTFTDTSKGIISNYLWDFGDLVQFNGQNPLPHVYTVSRDYDIRLIVTDTHGCNDTAVLRRFVTPTPVIGFTGLKAQYCTGSEVFLRRTISRYITGYVWDNGDGKTFTNEVDVNYSYPAEGLYTITLTGTDRYCGTATAQKTVPVYKVPVVKLPADTVLCQNDQLLIGVAPNAAYNFVWNTGATTSQILTSLFTRDYTLTAENHGCKGYDAMHVKVLTACLIKVPNAFTPNRDGVNDELLATNADLAQNFSFKIFNRNGQMVFASKNPLQGWDGSYKGNPQESGTYVWILSYTDPWTGKFVNQKGTSILLR